MAQGQGQVSVPLLACLLASSFVLPAKFCCLLNQMMLRATSRAPAVRIASREGVLNSSNKVHCFWGVQKVGAGGGCTGDAVKPPVAPESWATRVAAKFQDWEGGGGLQEQQQGLKVLRG